ncbi:sodium ABC transporter ATP-binding protein [Staphylococcus simulans]|uniref:ABC transporter ATP-binding protein n=1 Tax=Staphylococcus simulans TaxID=1286 RepID=UPI000D1F7E5E|nr:ABC transporter ATP-binding protein [Staphylococcus simulans]PTJ06268.1 sodium ABC transporter ATP-binding protein [Staphylococcus simulans]
MALVLEDVTKQYGDKTVVNDISLTLEKGKMLGFLGRNGAGKTTTFRMILGLTPLTKGIVTYNGEKMGEHMFNQVGYLPEERGLHPKMKVADELRYLATLKGMSKKDFNQALDYWLNRFEINENRDKKIESLSKGNQQKIQLLASLIHKPELLILDEPFSGLDPVNVELLKSAVKDLNEQGTTIIFSSHRMEHIEELCDDICILNHGDLVLQGDIQSIKDQFDLKKIVVETEDALEKLEEVEGVTRVERSKRMITVSVENQAAAKRVFDVVAQHGFVKRFQVLEPSIQDIFIQQVGDIHE